MQNKRMQIAIILIILVVVLLWGLVTIVKDDFYTTNYEPILHTIAKEIHVEWSSLPKGRSDLFPVVGYEQSGRWKVLTVDTEQVFVLSFASSAAAQEILERSKDAYPQDFVAQDVYIKQFDSFILLYRGSDSDIVQ